MNPCKRHNICFVAAIFCATVLFFEVQRALWLVYYHAQAGAFGAADMARVFLYGLQLDASTAGYVAALPLLLSIAAIWLPRTERTERIMRRAATAYFVAVAAVMSWIFTVDMGLFEYWQARIDSQILIYSPREMLASLTPWQFIVGALYFTASTAAAVALYRLIYRCLFIIGQPRRTLSTGIMLLAAGVLFAVIRGGFSPAVANVSKVYFSRDMFLNQAAVNPVFSFLSTVVGGDDYDRYRFFDETTAEELFHKAVFEESGDETQPSADETDAAGWLTTDRPDILLVIVEGFGRTLTDAEWKGEPVAPNINTLKEEGIWFENLYASSFRTDRGTVAVLSGFPAQPQTSIMKDVRKAAALPGIARTLSREAGYRSRFFYGGDANFTNTRAYLFSTGFDEVVDEKDMPGGEQSKWGYADDKVMDYVVRKITDAAADDAPHFDVWLTLSSHEPFEVPYSRLDNDMLNAFAFTDEVIGDLVGRLKTSPAWDDLLLIVIPDHGYQYPAEIGYNTPRRHHIQMLWTGGAVARPIIVDDYASQTDLAATLLGQLGLSHEEFEFSRDLARRGTTRFGYYTFNNGFGVVDSLGATIYDCTADMTLLDEQDTVSARLDRGKAMLQTTFARIRGL